MPIIIAPSILAADFANLASEARRVEEGKADWLHIDVMDGHFARKITIGAPVVKSLKRHTSLPLDVHLMIENPDNLLEDFIEAGAAIITVHAEACRHLQRTLSHIRKLGAKAAVALNPATAPEVLRYVVDDVDMVRLLSINPGFGSQPFIKAVVPKIAAVRRLLDEGGNRQAMVSVDGSVDEVMAEIVSAAGADVLVAGKSVFSNPDAGAAITKLRQAALRGCEQAQAVAAR